MIRFMISACDRRLAAGDQTPGARRASRRPGRRVQIRTLDPAVLCIASDTAGDTRRPDPRGEARLGAHEVAGPHIRCGSSGTPRRTRRCRRRSPAAGAAGGFSLIEALCALIVLGVGLVGITEGITLALQMSKDSERVTTASLLAAGNIETIRAEGYLTAGEEEGDFGDELPLYGWRRTIAETSLDGLYEVTVTVEQKKTKEELYELRTLIFEMPISSSLSTLEGRENEKAPGRGGPERGARPGGRP